MQNLNIYHTIQELYAFSITANGRMDSTPKGRAIYRFAFHCLDSVEIYKHAKFDQHYTVWFKSKGDFHYNTSKCLCVQRSLVTILHTCGWTIEINQYAKFDSNKQCG